MLLGPQSWQTKDTRVCDGLCTCAQDWRNVSQDHPHCHYWQICTGDHTCPRWALCFLLSMPEPCRPPGWPGLTTRPFTSQGPLWDNTLGTSCLECLELHLTFTSSIVSPLQGSLH
jgi:hypothetical protein